MPEPFPDHAVNPATVREAYEILLPGGHHVAELLGERAPLDTAVRTSRELPALGTAAGMEQGLAAAADNFSARLAGAVALLVHQIEQTSDRVHAAMTAYAAQDTASAAQLDDVTRQLG